MPLEKGEDGRLHFAAAPGQVAAQVVTGAIATRPGVESGNTKFNPSSGRFAGPNDQNTPATAGTGMPIGPGNVPETGLPAVVNEYIAIVTTQFDMATSMAIYQDGDSSTIVLFDKNGARLTAFPVPNAEATQEQLTKFTEEVHKPAIERAEADRIAAMTRSTVPEGVDPDEWAEHQDVIRQAARTTEDIDAGAAHQFLADRGAANVDAEQFRKDVREQRLDDLADVLDHQLQGKVEQIKRARSAVRVTAPSGWTKRVFAGLDDNEVIKLLTRLEGKGWDPEDLKKHIIERIADPERAAKIAQMYGEPKKKRGKKTPKTAKLSDDDWQDREEELEAVIPTQPAPEPVNLGEELARVAGAMPQPVHNIYVTMPDQKPMRRKPVRDANNVITEVIEEPVIDG
jgi:hypothetical protein